MAAEVKAHSVSVAWLSPILIRNHGKGKIIQGRWRGYPPAPREDAAHDPREDRIISLKRWNGW
jgi:hypothetical protein